MKFERLPFLIGQAQEKSLGPLKAKASFPGAGIDEEILQTGRPNHFPLLLQLAASRISQGSNPLGLLWIDIRRERSDASTQDGIVSRRGERRVLLSRIGGGDESCEDEKSDNDGHTTANPDRSAGKHKGHMLTRGGRRQATGASPGEMNFQNAPVHLQRARLSRRMNSSVPITRSTSRWQKTGFQPALLFRFLTVLSIVLLATLSGCGGPRR